jgi:membrane associated rhomboid family serine protease
MAYRSRSSSRSFFAPDWFPPGVKLLLIVNLSIFFAIFFAGLFGIDLRWFTVHFELHPSTVVIGAVWQLVTYGFLHGGVQHIFWNALSLWMFGMMLERAWGTRRFLEFYFTCLIGAAVFTVIGAFLFQNPEATYIGMSGAVFGLLVAFGFVFKDQTVMFSFVFPMKAQYMAMIMGAVWLLMSGPGSLLPHLGGMVTAFVYMLYFQGRKKMPNIQLGDTIRHRYKQWKIERAKKKFQVYLRKNDPDRDRWVN